MDLPVEPMDTSYRFIGSNGSINGYFIGRIDRRNPALSMRRMRPALGMFQDFFAEIPLLYLKVPKNALK